MANLQGFMKDRQDAPVLETTTFDELCEVLEPDNFQVVESNSGNLYFQMANDSTDKYFTIRIGDKVGTLPEGPEMMAALIDNYVIYIGETDNGKWMSFGPKPTSNKPRVSASKETLFALIGRKVGELKP